MNKQQLKEEIQSLPFHRQPRNLSSYNKEQMEQFLEDYNEVFGGQ